MNRKTAYRRLIATLALLFAAPAAAQTVMTRSGAVSGVTQAGVTAFRGIPYAAPPVGPLRWRPPQPPAPWKGVRAASETGPACMQPPLPGEDRGSNPAISEDCLYLNIWRPAVATTGAKRPVMVWIHGGGFYFGTGARAAYNGANLARDGVIIVTLNYRLGRFGWFAYPELTKKGGKAGTGNFGLMDDIAALKWVRANIAAFGGDPANVTVFGESAGGIAVNALMTIRAARGLFAKAITQSGFGRVPPQPLKTAEQTGSAFARSAGAANLAALRKLPAAVVLGPEDARYAPLEGPWPILDGKLITGSVAQIFAAGNEAKVPWMVGSNDFEASLFPSRLANPDAALEDLPPPLRDTMITLYDPTHNRRQKSRCRRYDHRSAADRTGPLSCRQPRQIQPRQIQPRQIRPAGLSLPVRLRSGGRARLRPWGHARQ